MSQCDKNILNKGKRLINNVVDVPKDSLLGLVAINPSIGIINIGNTVVRRDYKSIDNVKIVSGGSSGHEPMFCGYVGKGMLTAAIQGDVFCSPSTHNILHLLKELTRKKIKNGLLVIIQNNTGDTLNFGLGVEKAINLGIKTKLLVIADDCSDEITKRKPRGLTGTILIQKIAGAMAEESLTLTEIYEYCNKLQEQLASALIGLQNATSTNKATCICSNNLNMDEVEFGAGLHGERSPKRKCLSTTELVCDELLNVLNKKLVFEENATYAVLINNMLTTKIEENIFVNEIIKKLHSFNIKIMRIYVGTFMTSMDMKGFSVTMLKTDEVVLKYLDYPTEAQYWKHITHEITPDSCNLIKASTHVQKYSKIPPQGPKLVEHEANVVLLVTQFACDALISCERQLNIIDKESGDGDTGTRLRIVAENILHLLYKKEVNLEYLHAYFLKLSRVVEDVGGSMGAIYGIIFQSAAKFMSKFDENTAIEASLWVDCLKEVVQCLQNFTQIEQGHNTMLDPLIACAQYTADSLEKGNIGVDAFDAGVIAAEEAAIHTKLSNKNHPDPGAHSVGIWLRAIYEGAKLRCGN